VIRFRLEFSRGTGSLTLATNDVALLAPRLIVTGVRGLANLSRGLPDSHRLGLRSRVEKISNGRAARGSTLAVSGGVRSGSARQVLALSLGGHINQPALVTTPDAPRKPPDQRRRPPDTDRKRDEDDTPETPPTEPERPPVEEPPSDPDHQGPYVVE
jgi:hypothetical protein